VQAIDERSDGTTVRPINKSSYVEKRYKRLRENALQLLKCEEERGDNWETLINNLVALQPHLIPPLLPSELFPIGDIPITSPCKA
jgi:hypothetical protein